MLHGPGRTTRPLHVGSSSHPLLLVICLTSSSKWFLSETGHQGLNNLLAAYPDKSAEAVCTFGYAAGPGHKPVLFQGRCPVRVAPAGMDKFRPADRQVSRVRSCHPEGRLISVSQSSLLDEDTCTCSTRVGAKVRFPRLGSRLRVRGSNVSSHQCQWSLVAKRVAKRPGT